MALLDKIKDTFISIIPQKSSPPRMPPPPSGFGTVGGAGTARFEEDDMIISKPAIVFHSSQAFFNFLAMCCFAAVASFQAKWHVGPSGLSDFALLISIGGIFLPLFMMLIPVAYEKYDKFIRLARALKEVRVGFILTTTGTVFALLIAFSTTISAWTEAGCKDPSKDPNAKAGGDGFKNGLPGWCSTKKAGAIFFWLALGFWGASLGLLILDWRSGKLHTGPRDPPFTHPSEATEYDMDEDVDMENTYEHVPPARRRPEGSLPSNISTTSSPNQTPGIAPVANPFSDDNQYSGYNAGGGPGRGEAPAAGRPSIDAYGAFTDPAPSGYSPAPGVSTQQPSSYGYTPTASAPYTPPPQPRYNSPGPPRIPEPDFGNSGGFNPNSTPGVSRTMQYADPYAAVRASIAGGGASQPGEGPPGYTGYR